MHRSLSTVLAVLSAVGAFAPALAAPCTVTDKRLIGEWLQTNGAGFFEQMKFALEKERNVFDSWLHERPEIADGTWSLEKCVLRISGPDPALTFVYSVNMPSNARLELREKGRGVAKYRRVKDVL